MFAVEDVALGRVDGNILQHTDEVESAEFLDETEPGLNRVVIMFEGGEEEGENDGEPDNLHNTRDEKGWLAAKIDKGPVDEDGVGRDEGRGFADQRAKLSWC